MQIEPEKLLADLAAKVARLGLLQEQTEERQGQVEELVEHLQEGVTGLTTEVREFGALLAALAPPEPEDEEEDEGLDPCQVPNWRELDAEQTAEQWGILVDWCRGVLYPTYARPAWRPCWYRHWEVVEELSTLCAVWHWSYLKDAPPTRAAEWHARWWPHTRAVMREAFHRCGPETTGAQMRHPIPRTVDPNLFANDEDLSDFIDAHVRNREAEAARAASTAS